MFVTAASEKHGNILGDELQSHSFHHFCKRNHLRSDVNDHGDDPAASTQQTQPPCAIAVLTRPRDSGVN